MPSGKRPVNLQPRPFLRIKRPGNGKDVRKNGRLEVGAGPGLGQALERVLGVDALLVGKPLPAACGAQLPGKLVVGEEDFNDLIQAELKIRVVDRSEGFNPPIEVAGHEIG